MAVRKVATFKEDRPVTNPEASWVSPSEFRSLVSGFYGTRTLMFDRAMAEAVLEMNTGNRKVNRRKLQELVSQLRGNEFENTGEPIIMAVEGVVNSGQHRLMAIAEADAVVDLDVRFGVPRKVFSKTDTGVSRTSGDVLTIKGVRAGRPVASAIRLALLYERGLPDSIRDLVSNDAVGLAFDRWPDMETVVSRVNAFSYPKAVKSAPFFVTAFLASRTPQKGKLDAWLEAVATGLEVGRDHPAYQLRERLLRGVEAAVGTREGQLERFALMIKSWNLWAANETVSMREFKWVKVGRYAEDFPRIGNARL